jgi:L-rhamnose mutarotase
MKLKHGELGGLKENVDVLWKVMLDEIKKHGYSDNTLTMEGTARAIYDIIKLNDIEE